MVFLFFVLTAFYLFYLRFDIYNAQVALIIPWVIIFVLHFYELSYIHGSIGLFTILIVLCFVFSYCLGFQFLSRVSVFPKFISLRPVRFVVAYKFDFFYYRIFAVLFLFLTILNVVLAGYIPLFRLLDTGVSGYFDFGVSGIYGFYLAFANIFGLLSFFVFLVNRRFLYLAFYFVVLFVFVIFMTRQNLFSLLIESFLVHGFVRKRFGVVRVALFGFFALLLFSVLGDFRSDSIKSAVEVRSEYAHLPSFIFWVYSYFYISAVNFGNLVSLTSAPYYDGSLLMELVPNFVKILVGYDKSHHEFFLQKANFTASTSLSSIYSDLGSLGLLLFAFFLGSVTAFFYKKSKKFSLDFFYLSTYSVLFFCSLFSFFANFWFYLPIVFQIPIAYVFSKLVVVRERHCHR
jgi:oligosaccharide repeat unit polymerase